MASEIIISSQA